MSGGGWRWWWRRIHRAVSGRRREYVATTRTDEGQAKAAARAQCPRCPQTFQVRLVFESPKRGAVSPVMVCGADARVVCLACGAVARAVVSAARGGGAR